MMRRRRRRVEFHPPPSPSHHTTPIPDNQHRPHPAADRTTRYSSGEVGWRARPYKENVRGLTTSPSVVRRSYTIYLSAMVGAGQNGNDAKQQS